MYDSANSTNANCFPFSYVWTKKKVADRLASFWNYEEKAFLLL